MPVVVDRRHQYQWRCMLTHPLTGLHGAKPSLLGKIVLPMVRVEMETDLNEDSKLGWTLDAWSSLCAPVWFVWPFCYPVVAFVL